MTTLFAAGATGLTMARLALLVALHFVDSDYDPVRHAVSDYAVGRTRRLSTVMTWTGLLAWVALAGATWTGLSTWDHHAPATVELLVLAAIFALLPLVPTDLEGGRRTVRGLLHYALAIAWFAIAYSLAGDFAVLARQEWPRVIAAGLVVLHGCMLVGLVALVAALSLQPLRRCFGITERVFLLATVLFYLTVATALLIR